MYVTIQKYFFFRFLCTERSYNHDKTGATNQNVCHKPLLLSLFHSILLFSPHLKKKKNQIYTGLCYRYEKGQSWRAPSNYGKEEHFLDSQMPYSFFH